MNNDLLSRRIEKVLPSKEGLEKLLSKKKIRLYQGFDPTASRLHLGHTVGLRKLMEFAHAGHEVIVLFGTGTVLVGDPSLRETGRKLITQEEIDANITTWKDQVAPIVDFHLVTIKQNSDWLTKLTLKDIIKIGSNISAIQLFKRDSFTKRIEKGDPVWYHETMYPLLQGYDSVEMDVDLEIGGTDQEFNMLVGRELQRKMNNREKFVITTPMIPGTDGKTMAKTSGNCVWLDDKPEDMYGKLMGVQDELISTYFELLTDIPLNEIASLDPNKPMENKKRLAHTITTQFHNEELASKAQTHFKSTVQHKELPKNIQEVSINHDSMTLLNILSQSNLNTSNSEVKRVIKQGGVEINGTRITDPNQKIEVKSGTTIKFGKREWRKIK